MPVMWGSKGRRVRRGLFSLWWCSFGYFSVTIDRKVPLCTIDVPFFHRRKKGTKERRQKGRGDSASPHPLWIPPTPLMRARRRRADCAGRSLPVPWPHHGRSDRGAGKVCGGRGASIPRAQATLSRQTNPRAPHIKATPARRVAPTAVRLFVKQQVTQRVKPAPPRGGRAHCP